MKGHLLRGKPASDTCSVCQQNSPVSATTGEPLQNSIQSAWQCLSTKQGDHVTRADHLKLKGTGMFEPPRFRLTVAEQEDGEAWALQDTLCVRHSAAVSRPLSLCS